MSTNVIVTYNVKPEALPLFATIVQQVKMTLPLVEGCEGLTVYNSTQTPTIFTLVEKWTSQEAHQAHIKKITDAGMWDQLMALVEKVEHDYFTQI